MPLLLEAIHNEWIIEKKLWLPLWRGDPGLPRHTIYFGGGTPSLCPAEKLVGLCSVFRSDLAAYGLETGEITVEANPSDLTTQYCRTLLTGGINRLSMGIQSFYDPVLKEMRRRHTAREALDSFHTAREAGFGNISIDLIFGFPNLNLGIWEDTLHQALCLKPEHISAYQLSLEPGLSWADKQNLPPEEDCAAQYALLQKILQENGYVQYEISSFALPGAESRHNSAYWQRIPYLGLGPSAHSFNGQDRYWNKADINRYISGISDKKPVRSYDRLTPFDVFNELIMLGLRTAKGMDLRIFREMAGERTHTRFLEQAMPFIQSGKLKKEGDRLAIPLSHLFTADSIIRDCLLLPE